MRLRRSSTPRGKSAGDSSAGVRSRFNCNRGCQPPRADLKVAKKALMQLLENAAKYSPPDQPITITAELTGNFVLTSVADRGSGIDDSEQALIFDKFYRGKDHRYAVQGTGM